MSTITERKIIFVRSHKLIPSLIYCGATLSKFVESEPIEFLAVGVNVTVVVNWVRRNFDGDIWGYVLSVG